MILFSRSVALWAGVALLCAIAVPAATAQVVSGFNLSADPTVLDFPYQDGEVHYAVNTDLIFEPSAGPMIKRFASPTADGEPIVLEPNDPMPLIISENFTLPGTTPNLAVRDWHEEILTPGWVFVIPDFNSQFPGLFPPGETLITRDGEPWEFEVTGGSPFSISVAFDPIEPGHVLDVHKALYFIGTPEDSMWGDDPDETYIEILEYPTPEPSSLLLAGLGAALALVFRRRQSRHGAVGR